MTSSFLQSELTGLITDSKKRSSDVRAAAEKSLAELKAISVTSELQLAGDLLRKPHFIDPFVLACQAKNAKLANSATTCLQRLVASRAVPQDRLGDVLGAFRDVMSIGYDVQLKILQTLPALLQLYASEVHGKLLARVLEICASLQASRTELVSSSASATLEQLIGKVFEEAATQPQAQKDRDSNGTGSAQRSERYDGHGEYAEGTVDAVRIFQDFCFLLNRSDPAFLHTDSLPTL